MAFAKKTWKDRIAEFPTRRRLTKEDNTSELVTVAREEGTLSQEGDAFSAENMNDLENRIDAEFTAVNGKLQWFDIKSVNGTYTAVGTNDNAEICRLSLTPGTWLLLGYIYNTMSKDTIYNNSIFRESLSYHCQTVRSTLIGGGGSVNSYAITVQTNTNMILGTYDNSNLLGNVFRGSIYAIRLKKL